MNNPVFYNQERSGYEELVSYGPYFYKDILEMDANYQFAGKTLDIMAEGLEAIISNQFIDSADESTILRMERWLGVETDFSRTLEDRRKKVKLVWNGGEKLSGSFIKNLVRSYTGCDDDPAVKMTTYLSINAYISSNKTVYISDLEEQLEKMKPAHIRMVLSLINYSKIKIGRKVSHKVYSYDKAGEKPDIATLGAAFLSRVISDSELYQKVYDHLQTSETAEAGTHPAITTLGANFESLIKGNAELESMVYSMLQTSENQEAGTYPSITTVGSIAENGISTDDTLSVSVSSYVECGTNQCGEEGL